MTAGDLRPLRAEDAEDAVALVVGAFAVADREAGREPIDIPDARRRAFIGRMRRFVDTDPEGSWAADDAEGLAGLGVAIRRGPLWGLSLLFVRPGLQGRGLGSRLLERTRGTADGATVEIIEASDDVRALRRYAGLGLTLHPAMSLEGKVDRTGLEPDAAGTREGGDGDLDLIEDVDRGLRGADATRTDDVAFLVEAGAELLVADRGAQRGYVVCSSGNPVCLGATDAATARGLLLAALARCEEDFEVHVEGVTAAQDWAFSAALETRLLIKPSGPMFLRGWAAFPSPYLPSGVYF